MREKLIELIGKATSACVGTDCFEGCKYYAENDCRYKLMADALIANGVTIQPLTDCKQPVGDKWVSTAERLPETFENVLVYNKTIGVVESAFITTHGEWVGVRMNSEVTHWMTLPTPPKEYSYDLSLL